MVVDLSNLWMYPLILAIVLEMCHAQSNNATTGKGFQFQLNDALNNSLEAMNRYIMCQQNLGDSYSTGPFRYENFNGNDV